MSGTRPPVSAPPPGSLTAGTARGKRFARRRRWPTAVMVLVSLAGIVFAIVAVNIPVDETRQIAGGAGFAIVIVAGILMLIAQRVLDVDMARKSGTPLISSFDIVDRMAFAVLLVASVANGIVIALEVARQ